MKNVEAVASGRSLLPMEGDSRGILLAKVALPALASSAATYYLCTLYTQLFYARTLAVFVGGATSIGLSQVKVGGTEQPDLDIKEAIRLSLLGHLQVEMQPVLKMMEVLEKDPSEQRLKQLMTIRSRALEVLKKFQQNPDVTQSTIEFIRAVVDNTVFQAVLDLESIFSDFPCANTLQELETAVGSGELRGRFETALTNMAMKTSAYSSGEERWQKLETELEQRLRANDFTITDVMGNGSCFYNCIDMDYMSVRDKVVDYMATKKDEIADDVKASIACWIQSSEDPPTGLGQLHQTILNLRNKKPEEIDDYIAKKSVDDYLAAMRGINAFASDLEIRMTAEMRKIRIAVYAAPFSLATEEGAAPIPYHTYGTVGETVHVLLKGRHYRILTPKASRDS